MLAELTACESEVMSPSERLWRQVPPGLCTDELPVIDAFIPSTKDERKLSVGLSSRISVEDCYHDYTGAMGCRSIGVMQLFVSSVSGAAETTNEKEPLTVRVVDDAECDQAPSWHGYIDFNGIEERGLRKAFAQRLWLAAVENGWAYGPIR